MSDWLLHGAIYEFLREERTVQESEAQTTPAGACQPVVRPLSPESDNSALKVPFWGRWIPGRLGSEATLSWRWAAIAAAGMVAVGWLGWQVILSHERPAHNATASGPVLAQQAPPPELRSVAGVLLATNGEVWVTAVGQTAGTQVSGANLTLYTGDAIRTGSNTLAKFTYPDGSALTIYHGTQLIVGRTNAALRVELVRGAVDADIRPQPAGKDMLATTKFMRSDIVGTQFRLMVGPISAWLGVRKGTVEVTRVSDGERIELGTGNYAAVHPKWPYARMDATVCPVWKGICRQAVGSEYP